MTYEQTIEAKRLALRWLRNRDYSRQELEQKLSALGFEPEIVQETLDWLGENGWQSDRRMAERLLERLTDEQPSGWKRIQDEFVKRGLAPPDELAEYRDEEERAIRALSHRFGKPPEESTVKCVRQWFQFLLRRGFEPETARRAMERWQPRLLDVNDLESL